jgi:subtilase family serine protease
MNKSRLKNVAMMTAMMSVLAACGGGSDVSINDAAPRLLSLKQVAAPNVPDVEAKPSFHRMPLSVSAPSDTDADGQGMSAYHAPDIVRTPSDLAGLTTKGLTDEKVDKYRSEQRSKTQSSGSGGIAAPAATSTSSVVYTPAQIRAAYNLPATSGATAANLGAGQTIYIVDAYSHPKAVSDLNYFSKQFGLPTCTQVAVPSSSTSLPPASTSSCTISVLYSTPTGAMTSTAPAYNSGWAQEIALDTQWAHSIAPLARIVLIEAASASLADLDGAIMLANKFGSGAVSMSFSAAESSWVNLSVYSSALFSTRGVSYFAATGDSGTAVNWPAVISTVVGVDGSSLSYTTSSRSEKTWSGTGGGISAYVTMPTYQTKLNISGEPSSGAKFRAVGDVSMDADPYTGVYVAFTASTATSTSWYAFGGTSLATPMWAAAVAVANANRAAYGYGTLSAPHAKLYGMLASNYSSTFYDITLGSNGTCISCYATIGYDVPSGLGSPHSNYLLPYLSSAL